MFTCGKTSWMVFTSKKCEKHLWKRDILSKDLPSNQLIGFYMRATVAFNGLNTPMIYNNFNFIQYVQTKIMSLQNGVADFN